MCEIHTLFHSVLTALLYSIIPILWKKKQAYRAYTLLSGKAETGTHICMNLESVLLIADLQCLPRCRLPIQELPVSSLTPLAQMQSHNRGPKENRILLKKKWQRHIKQRI